MKLKYSPANVPRNIRAHSVRIDYYLAVRDRVLPAAPLDILDHLVRFHDWFDRERDRIACPVGSYVAVSTFQRHIGRYVLLSGGRAMLVRE